MRLEHAALWTPDLERSRGFYERYFGARAGVRHDHAPTGFASYFLCFDGGSRLELMQMAGIAPRALPAEVQAIGLVHLAFDAGTPRQVDALTEGLRADGHPVIDEPHRTADGYYESTVLDPDGNRIEIVARPASTRRLRPGRREAGP